MCAFRIASLFSRPVNTKTPEPTEKKPIRDNSPMQEKRTAASSHVDNQLDGESTKNIKSAPKTRPILKHAGAELTNLNISSQLNPNDEKSLQSQGQISEVKDPEKIEADIMNSRSNPEEYRELYASVPETGKALGKAYKLNNCEVAAIYAYTGAYSAQINPALRDLKGENVKMDDAKSLEAFAVPTHLAEIISDYYKALEKLPPAGADKTISRGHGRDVTLPDDVLDKIKEGDVMSDSMFTSTTSSMEQMADTKWFGALKQLFIFHLLPNGRGRDISAFSKYKHESEIVFLPNTEFKVDYRKDDAIVGRGVDFPIFKSKIIYEFWDAFPAATKNKLKDIDLLKIDDTLGESFPYNLKGAKELMEDILKEEIPIDLEGLQNKIKDFYAEEYGGVFKPGKQALEKFFDAFPAEAQSNLNMIDLLNIKDTLGESFPFNLKGAKELMERILKKEFSIDLDALQNKIKLSYTQVYWGGIKPEEHAIEKFLDAFPAEAQKKLNPTELRKIKVALGEYHPFNLEGAKKLMEFILGENFSIDLEVLQNKIKDSITPNPGKHATEKFLDAFPDDAQKKLSATDLRDIKVALGESHPFNLERAKKLMDDILQKTFSIDLEVLQNEIVKSYSQTRRGLDLGFTKTIITLEEISSSDELKINSEKTLATPEKGMTSRTLPNSSRTEESERKIPVSEQNTKPAKKERKIPIKSQSNTPPQPNPSVKPSATNKGKNTSNFLNDDYTAPNTEEYYPGFRE